MTKASLHQAFKQIAKTEEIGGLSDNQIEALWDGNYVVYSAGWHSLTESGKAELAKLDAEDRAKKDKRNAASKTRNSVARSMGLKRTAYGWE